MLNKQLFKVASLLLLSLLFLTLKSADAGLLNEKLSAPLQPATKIYDLKISPDGQYMAFLADDITENAFELYSVPVDGSESPTLLSAGLLPTGSKVSAYHFTPDSNRVVYAADQDTGGIFELYSVPTTGGPIVKLSPPVSGTGNGVVGGSAVIGQDGSRVVFAAAWKIYGVFELFSVPVGGGIAVRLNGDFPVNGNLEDFSITPDGSQVVYLASQDIALVNELYIVDVAGGENVKLNSPLALGQSVFKFEINSDGSRVVYTSNEDVVGDYEIFSISLTDSAATSIQLNPPLQPNMDVYRLLFKLSPDGSRAVYLLESLSGKRYYYSVPVDGGTAVQLTTDTSGVPVSSGPYTLEISPDSNWLVFRSLLAGKQELFSVPLTGGSVIKLNDEIIHAGGQVYEFKISPDSSRVVYYGIVLTESLEIFSVPIGGGAVAKLNSALPAGGNVYEYQISDDSQRVVYTANQQVFDVKEIYSVPLADGVITKLNPSLVSGGSVSYFQIHPNSNHVFYVADQETDELRELFVSFEASPPPPEAPYSTYMPFIQN